MMELWTTEEAAAYLKLHPEYVRRRTRGGFIPAQKLGREWRYRRERLDAWIDAGCPSQKEQPSLFDQVQGD